MPYEEWLDNLEILKKENNNEILERLKNEDINNNINNMLYPKIILTIKEKFKISINKIISDLELMFDDKNYLDLYLINFKKNIKFILELINLKQIPYDKKEDLKKEIIKGTEDTYNILIKESRKEDPTGMLELTIKNNKIKWS
jgi:hypothetical protein